MPNFARCAPIAVLAMRLLFQKVPAGSGRLVPVSPRGSEPGGRDAPSTRAFRLPGTVAPAAFTLLELLAVIALLMLLGGFTLGLVRGMQQRAALARARAELAVLAQAIDAWSGHYGCFPPAADSAELYDCLTGRRGPQDGLLDCPGRTFIEAARFTLRLSDAAAPGNDLLDPWGQPYIYVPFTRTLNGHTSTGFVVFSSGPDGRTKPGDPPSTGPAAGQPDLAASENADNLYSDR